MNPNNVMALDVGERRIGVALAGLTARLPRPAGFIDLLKTPDAFKEILSLIEKHSVSTLVIGLPRGLNAQETEQTKTIRKFASKLAKKITIPVVMQDEAGTSQLAEEMLISRRKPHQKGDIDAEAAALILNDWLNFSLEYSS